MIKYIQHILVVGRIPNQDYLRLEKNYFLFNDYPIIIIMFSTKDPLTLQIICRSGISCLYNLIKLFRNAIKTVHPTKFELDGKTRSNRIENFY